MSLAKQGAVYATEDVGFVASIAVSRQEDDGVDHQQKDDGRYGVAVGHGECKERGGTVTESNTLQHGEDADGGERKEVALDGHVDPMNGQADKEDEHRATEYLPRYSCRQLEVEFTERQIGADTHDEEKEGEH